MLGLFVLMVAVVIVVLWVRRGDGFAAGFAGLLERPTSVGQGLAGFLTGRERVTGEFGGRPVVLELQHRRSGHALGHLVVALQPRGLAPRPDGADPFLWDYVRGAAGREALSQLEKRHGLQVVLADGWIRATWMPVGFLIFPGRFEADRWRAVLTALGTAASAIEEAGISG